MIPKISVIIPVYNVDKYIVECLESVTYQTYKDFECILIDDGSTDKSGIICDQYQKKDSHFKVYHKKNGGVSAARNFGLEHANAEYIVFVDPDDYLEFDYLENAILDITDCDLVLYNAFSIYENSESIGRYLGNSEEKVFEENELFIVRRYTLNRHIPNIDIPFMGTPWMKVFKKQIIKCNNLKFLENVHPFEDTVFIFDYLKNCQKIRYVNKPFYHYRIRNESSVRGVRKDRYENFDFVQRALLEKCDGNKYLIDEVYVWSVGQLWFCLSRQTFNKRCFPRYFDRKKDFYEHIYDGYIIQTLCNVNMKSITYEKKIMIYLYKRKMVLLLNLMCMIYDYYKRI